MTVTARPGRLRVPARPVRHIALATALVLVVIAVLGGLSLASYRAADHTLRVFTARATGTVVGASAGGAVVTWAGQSVTVAMTGSVPPVGTRTQIAYDPADPATAIIPGAAVLTDADRSRDGVLFAGFLLVLVLLVDGWLLVSRWWVARRPGADVVVRRISMRRGLMARTWLETEDSRWIPVYFDPAVVTLPAPTTVRLHGDRLIAVQFPGMMLYPSGRVRRVEPAGRRTDSPVRPDDYTAGRAVAAARWRHQLRVDAALLVPAPVLGILWAYLDDGGVLGWLGATTVTAVLALWWAAIRGADPT